jgi:ribosomal protein S18 acetylase RimI-like enzyme
MPRPVGPELRMSLQWIHENPAYWDDGKASILGGAPEGVFDLGRYGPGEILPGEWWRVEDQGSVVGYGWMDVVWGDGEILLAVDSARQRQGVGTFILDQLEREAATRGLHYLYNVIRPTHPDRAGTIRWLEKRRFQRSRDGDRLMRRVAHAPRK